MKFKNGGFNEEAFTPEEIEKGAHIELINTLLKLDTMAEDGNSAFHDIHICSDGYCLVVQWCRNGNEVRDTAFRRERDNAPGMESQSNRWMVHAQQ